MYIYIKILDKMQRHLKSLYVLNFIKSKNVKNITFRCLRQLVHKL